MKKFLFIIILVQSLVLFSAAQVYNGDLVFSNQADIDNFSTAPYTSVNGSLRVQDDLDGQHDITNLAGLAGLTAVSGVVDIIFNNLLPNTAFLNFLSVGWLSIRNNPALTTINGMGALTLLPGQLRIESNSNLANVTAFNNLTTVGNLEIRQNLLLTNLTGFSNLTNVTTTFILDNNSNLADLNAFTRLNAVGGTFIIRNHPQLFNMNGLSGLRRTGTLTITNNPLLTNLNGLATIEVITNTLEVSQNLLLQHINGFPNLDTLGELSVRNNNALLTIGGFEQVTGMGNLYIELNPALTSISGFVNAGAVRTVLINRNLSLTTISGFSVADTIYGDFILDNNHSLTSMNAFPNLVRINSRMLFINNYVLSTVNAMPQLDYAGSIRMSLDTLLLNLNFLSSLKNTNSISISACNRLTDLNSLSNINGYVRDEIRIGLNNRLVSISGLSGIDSVGEEMYITSNPVLTNIVGLQNIRKVGLDFHLTGSPLVTNINQLIRLDSVGRDLLISGNPGLTNLDGLTNLRIVKGVVAISNNQVLSSFCGLYNLYANGGPVLGTLISQNPVNPTPQQIIAAGPCAGTLPVRLLFFNLQCLNNNVKLNWKTGGEENGSHFIVEKSVDARSWAGIATIPAAGNTRSEKDYSFIDNTPSQNAFYRLAQYDINGAVHYSGVLRASCAVKELITTWPNPANDRLFLSINTNRSSKAIISLFSSSGVLIKKQQSALLTGTTQIVIDIKNISTGVYYVHVAWNEGVNIKTIKLIKQ
jgi:Secretion system C-terminal sorting domain